MFAAKPVMAAVLAIGVAYVACPYVALYRLGDAIRTSDAATLQTLVDWPAVREGIKEDICDNVADDPDATGSSSGKLAPFGASFMRGIAANAVDLQVTPAGLVDMTRQHAAGPATHRRAISVNWAFFDNPVDFMVSVNAPGQRAPIRLQMSLRDTGWQVTRVWLPPALLGQTNAPTS